MLIPLCIYRITLVLIEEHQIFSNGTPFSILVELSSVDLSHSFQKLYPHPLLAQYRVPGLLKSMPDFAYLDLAEYLHLHLLSVHSGFMSKEKFFSLQLEWDWFHLEGLSL
jgi:hypothetical protein